MNNSAVESSDTGAAQSRPVTLVFLKDGTSFGVTDYWLANDELHYVTSYGGANAIGMSRLDLQKTVNENSKRGVKFILTPRADTSVPSQMAVPGGTT